MGSTEGNSDQAARLGERWEQGASIMTSGKPSRSSAQRGDHLRFPLTLATHLCAMEAMNVVDRMPYAIRCGSAQMQPDRVPHCLLYR